MEVTLNSGLLITHRQDDTCANGLHDSRHLTSWRKPFRFQPDRILEGKISPIPCAYVLTEISHNRTCSGTPNIRVQQDLRQLDQVTMPTGSPQLHRVRKPVSPLSSIERGYTYEPSVLPCREEPNLLAWTQEALCPRHQPVRMREWVGGSDAVSEVRPLIHERPDFNEAT